MKHAVQPHPPCHFIDKCSIHSKPSPFSRVTSKPITHLDFQNTESVDIFIREKKNQFHGYVVHHWMFVRVWHRDRQGRARRRPQCHRYRPGCGETPGSGGAGGLRSVAGHHGAGRGDREGCCRCGEEVRFRRHLGQQRRIYSGGGNRGVKVIYPYVLISLSTSF